MTKKVDILSSEKYEFSLFSLDKSENSFYNVKLGNKLVRQLFPGKTFLDKNDYQDPSKIIGKLLHSL